MTENVSQDDVERPDGMSCVAAKQDNATVPNTDIGREYNKTGSIQEPVGLHKPEDMDGSKGKDAEDSKIRKNEQKSIFLQDCTECQSEANEASIGSEYWYSVIGNNNTQVNIDFGNKTFTDTSKEETFPLSRFKFSDEFLSSLKNYRCFYTKHNWLIVIRNDENVSYHFDITKQLIQCDASRSYRVQTGNIECRDYIKNKDKLSYGKPTLTKIVVQDLHLFFRFFKEPENVTELTLNLKECDNILIFVIDADKSYDIAVKLERHLETNKRKYGIWTPMPEKLESEVTLPLNELSIIERSTLSIAAWFDSLPYELFQKLMLIVLEARAEKEKQTNEDGCYPQWWNVWHQNPDQGFIKLGLTNCRMPDEDIHTVRFIQPGESNLRKEEMLGSAMYNVLEIWPALKQVLFSSSGHSIQFTHWQSHLAPEVAIYLESLHKTGLLSVDVEFLVALYDEVRYAKCNETIYFFRFAYLVKYLFIKDLCRETVVVFIKRLQELMIKDEQKLINDINRDMKVLKSLPIHMQKLAQMAKVSVNEVEKDLFFLKDRIHASCFMLEIVFGTDSPHFLERYSFIINPRTKQICNKLGCLPTYEIYERNLKIILTKSASNLIGLSEQLSNIDENNDEILLFDIARDAFLTELDNTPVGMSSLNGLNYLYDLLNHEHGIKIMIQLLYPRFRQYKDYSPALIFTLRRMKRMLILQEKEDAYINAAMSNVLHLCAKNISKDQYGTVKDLCLNLVIDSRQMLIDNTDKNIINEIIANKHASLFVKKAFNRSEGQLL